MLAFLAHHWIIVTILTILFLGVVAMVAVALFAMHLLGSLIDAVVSLFNGDTIFGGNG